MNTFYLDGNRSEDNLSFAYEIQGRDFDDVLRQISAFQAGIAYAGMAFSIERLSTKPTRGVKYVRGW